MSAKTFGVPLSVQMSKQGLQFGNNADVLKSMIGKKPGAPSLGQGFQSNFNPANYDQSQFQPQFVQHYYVGQHGVPVMQNNERQYHY